jgi:DNA polymerase-3 subunit delta'
VVAQLRRAVKGGRVPHAYLFTGPPRAGKHTTAIALAAALNCEVAPGEGCGTCDACARIFAGIHPDVQTLEREGAAQIVPIETIRTRVLAQLGLPPHEGLVRVFLIEEATALQGASANALLKTLEEPPARTMFIIGTTAPEQLLPTIRSRCQRVSFAALPPDLRAHLDADDEAAARLDALASTLMDAAAADDLGSIYRAAQRVSEGKGEVVPALELFAQRLHDEARAAAEVSAMRRAAGLGRRASLVIESLAGLTLHNAHGQITVEALLHQIRAVAVPPADAAAGARP